MTPAPESQRRWRTIAFVLLTGALVGPAVPQTSAAFGVEKFVAVNCSDGFAGCGEQEVELAPTLKYSFPKEPTKAEAEEQGYTQAGGHVPYGVTDFQVATSGTFPNEAPEGVVTHIRTDVPPGLATSPVAAPQCTEAEFGAKEAVPGTGFYFESSCPAESRVGMNKVTVYVGPDGVAPGISDLPLEGSVYNLVQQEGAALEFGSALKLPIPLTKAVLHKAFEGTPLEGTKEAEFLEEQQYFAHTEIIGNVEWGQQPQGTGKGDYHDYFEIDVSPALPLITSRLVFFGRSGRGDLITNATSCPGNLTSRIALTDEEHATATRTYTTPVPLTGCSAVPFAPSFALTPATTAQDTPDGFATVLGIPHEPSPTTVDSSQLKSAVVTMPEGMTLNPAAAAGLTACTPAQARIHSEAPGVDCPASSQIGTFSLEVPTLPPGSLTGAMYLGGPESGPITGPPYTIYLDAESQRYGVSVRLKGEATPDAVSGRVTTVFSENPEQPFTSATLHFKEGALAPVANPLLCGSATTASTLTPYSGTPPQSSPSSFTVDSNGSGGACPFPPPLAPLQSTLNQTQRAGSHTSFTFVLERSDGQQYLSEVTTKLPAGFAGAIPAATRCGEPDAARGTCAQASRIGTATVQSGAGPTPYMLSGPVYLTGPYDGAPFGLSIAVPAVAGPFDLGTVVTRASIEIDQSTARVTLRSVLPRIVGGIPTRIRRIAVAIDRQGFLTNPTSCGPHATESSVSGFTPGSAAASTVSLSTPFPVVGCSELPFKPVFKAATSAHTSRANGASLETTIDQPPGQANIKSVFVQLPAKLPSRLSTLNKACTAAVFAANPYGCGDTNGGVRANTPLLPSKMTGPVYFVARGGAQFPDIDLVLNADGVRVVVVGETRITKGITTTRFRTTPDVPVSSITVNLPVGPRSALAAYGSLCKKPLYMPTTIEGQNGKVFKQKTKIRVRDCGVQILSKKVRGETAYVKVRTFAAGRISGSGRGLRTVYRHLRRAVKSATFKVHVAAGTSLPLHTHIRVGFVPKKRSVGTSKAYTAAVFG